MDYSGFTPEEVVDTDEGTLVVEGTIDGDDAVVEAPIQKLVNKGINQRIQGVSEGQVVTFEAESGRGEFTVSTVYDDSDVFVVDGVSTGDMDDEFRVAINPDEPAEVTLFEIQRNGEFENYPLGKITDFEVLE